MDLGELREKICRLPTCFYGRYGLWVNGRCLLELGAGKKQDCRGRELDLWDPRGGGGQREQGSGKAAAGVLLQIGGWTLGNILKRQLVASKAVLPGGREFLQCSNGASHTLCRIPRWEVLKH